MLITSTIEICIQQLCWVEEMVFATPRSYASVVLGVLILSVCHTRALRLIQRTYRQYFYTTWKGNPCSQMWYFIQLCSSWQDFNWQGVARSLCDSWATCMLCLKRLELHVVWCSELMVMVNVTYIWCLKKRSQTFLILSLWTDWDVLLLSEC